MSIPGDQLRKTKLYSIPKKLRYGIRGTLQYRQLLSSDMFDSSGYRIEKGIVYPYDGRYACLQRPYSSSQRYLIFETPCLPLFGDRPIDKGDRRFQDGTFEFNRLQIIQKNTNENVSLIDRPLIYLSCIVDAESMVAFRLPLFNFFLL